VQTLNDWKSDEQMLNKLQRETFEYFTSNINERTGLIADKTQDGSPSSIAAVGLGLSCYITGDRKGWISHEQTVVKVLTVLRFFSNGHQGTEPDAMGYKGF
jgi:hypothetical protein